MAPRKTTRALAPIAIPPPPRVPAIDGALRERLFPVPQGARSARSWHPDRATVPAKAVR